MADLSWDINFTAEQVFWADLNCSLPERCSNRIAFGDNCEHHKCAYCRGKKYAATKVDFERTWQNQRERPLSWLVRGLLSIATVQKPYMTATEFDEVEQLDQEIEAKMKQRNWQLLDFAVIDPDHIDPQEGFFGYTEIPYTGKWRSDYMKFFHVEAWVYTMEHLAAYAELFESRKRHHGFFAGLPSRFQIQCLGPEDHQRDD